MAHFYVQTKSKMRYKPQSQWMDGVIKLWAREPDRGWKKNQTKAGNTMGTVFKLAEVCQKTVAQCGLVSSSSSTWNTFLNFS